MSEQNMPVIINNICIQFSLEYPQNSLTIIIATYSSIIGANRRVALGAKCQ